MKDKVKRLDPCRISDEELLEGQGFIFPDFGTPEVLKTVTPTSELPPISTDRRRVFGIELPDPFEIMFGR